MPENSGKIENKRQNQVIWLFFKDTKVDIHIFKMSVSMKVINISLF